MIDIFHYLVLIVKQGLGDLVLTMAMLGGGSPLASLLEPPLHRHVVLLQLLDLLDRLAIRDHKSLTPETVSLAALDWLQIQLILLLNEVFLISALDSQL